MFSLARSCCISSLSKHNKDDEMMMRNKLSLFVALIQDMPGQASVATIVIPTQLIIFRSPHKLLKTSTNRAVNWTLRNFIVPRQGPAHTIALQWTAFMIAVCYDIFRQFHVYNVSVSRFLVGTFSRHYEICEVSLTALSTSQGSSHQD